MNFDLFKSHAKTLAQAAKQFQSFDDMAAQDDYIHSEGLNVKQSGGTRTPSRVNSSNSLSRQEVLNSILTPTETLSPNDSSSDTSVSGYDSDDEDSGDTGEDDPVMHLIRSKKKKKKRRKSIDDNAAVLSSGDEEASPSRKSSRFMDDLDHRLSKPNVDVGLDLEAGLSQPAVEEQPLPVNDNTDNNNVWGSLTTNKSNKMWGSWTAKLATSIRLMRPTDSNDGTEMVPFRSPLAASKSRPETNGSASKEEEFSVVQSSSLLQAEDQAELDRIRKATQGDPLSIMMNIVKQHPQFVFIGFTLVLGAAVYFYTRHRGTEDDVG